MLRRGRWARGRAAHPARHQPGSGRTEAEAKDKIARLGAPVDPVAALRVLSDRLGHDLSTYDLDARIPELPASGMMQGHAVQLASLARRRRMTLRELRDYTAVSSGHRVLYGTAESIADDMEAWHRVSLHYRGGLSRGIGLLWEINGTVGDIQVTGANGHAQMVQLILAGGRRDARTLQPIEIPASFYAGLADNVLARNVACVYARMAADLRDGTRTAPSFDDAVTLHRLLAAMERSSEDGVRIAPAAV